MQKTLYTFVLLLLATVAGAQTQPCVDENGKSPTHQCNFPFSPVCACDGKTYFNECDAIQHGGIQGFQYTSGVCGDWEMFLGLDAPNRAIKVFFQFKPAGGTLTFMIVDIYGKIMRQQFISGNNFPIIIDINTQTFPPGVYIAYAFGGTYRKTIKFSAGNM